MKRIFLRVGALSVLCVVPVTAGAQLALGRDRLVADLAALREGTLTEHALVVLVSVVCLMCWIALVTDAIAGLVELRRGAAISPELRGSLQLLATVLGVSTLTMLSGLGSRQDAEGEGVSVGTAASLVAGTTTVGLTVGAASRARVREHPLRLLVEPDRARPVPTVGRVIVRTYGTPVVEIDDGRTARFRKSRSLELLVWLALNRERPSRSAARTAIWDTDISDSSFATVVSEMRRALSELRPDRHGHHWSAPSYGDMIPLCDEVVTDADLIGSLLSGFRSDPADFAEPLADELCRIRDLPFAGSNYAWPDLDGTTTRLVLLACTAIEELVAWALAHHRGRSMAPVVAAGLRMLPGNDQMLELQRMVTGLPLRRRPLASLRR